jgi:hypothetical protein
LRIWVGHEVIALPADYKQALNAHEMPLECLRMQRQIGNRDVAGAFARRLLTSRYVTGEKIKNEN